MEKQEQHTLAVDTKRFTVLHPVPPFVDIILKLTSINRREFSRILEVTSGYKNDPRGIEMVRLGGDASAKVPYLMEVGETHASILAILREVARPHVERLHSLPEPVQTCIHLLLSLNTVPEGRERFAIPALLEIDRMQAQIIAALQDMMAGRSLAAQFHTHNLMALQQLDKDWHQLRVDQKYPWTYGKLPEHAQMQFEPAYKNNRLIHIYETCVIVAPPDEDKLKRLTSPVLQRPLPENVPIAAIGSTDWLIREVGKVGRHFTRTLLGIIRARLEAEQLALEVHNYERITQRALDALREFVEKSP